jgi:hypothetical protein
MDIEGPPADGGAPDEELGGARDIESAGPGPLGGGPLRAPPSAEDGGPLGGRGPREMLSIPGGPGGGGPVGGGPMGIPASLDGGGPL